MNEKPLIIVTNDDGIDSIGLRNLVKALLPLGEVVVVAPQENQSAKGRSYYRGEDQGIIKEHDLKIGKTVVKGYAVNGTPGQCVLHAFYEIAKHIIKKPISIVCSGINIGENLASDLTLSGTVGACIEANIKGLKSIAFSVEYPFKTPSFKWSYLNKHIRKYVKKELARTDDKYRFLNVNFPNSIDNSTKTVMTKVGRGSPFYLVEKEVLRNINEPTLFELKFITLDEYKVPGTDIYAIKVDRLISVSRIKHLVE